MLGFFRKVEPSDTKVDAFCAWFMENNGTIIASVENSGTDRETMFKMLDEVEAQLAMVYRDGYNGEIQFEYGFNQSIGKWDLNLFHLNDKFLKKATAKIAEKINGQIGELWSANTGR